MGREQFVGAVAEVTGPLAKPADGEMFEGMVRLQWRVVARGGLRGDSAGSACASDEF